MLKGLSGSRGLGAFVDGFDFGFWGLLIAIFLFLLGIGELMRFDEI